MAMLLEIQDRLAQDLDVESLRLAAVVASAARAPPHC